MAPLSKGAGKTAGFDWGGFKMNYQHNPKLTSIAKVLRIPNNEVDKNFVGVCECIDLAVKTAMTR